MKVVVTLYDILCRLATAVPMLPVFATVSLFVAPGGTFSWGAFTSYHLLCLIYLLLDGLHGIILNFRTAAFDNLVSNPLFPTLTPGTIVCTDKKFNTSHAVWCLLLGIGKGSVAVVQTLYFTMDLMTKTVFVVSAVLGCLVVVSEIIMLGVIAKGLESSFLSVSMGTDMENAPQQKSPCRYLFRVGDSRIIGTTI